MEGQQFHKTTFVKFRTHPRIQEERVDIWLVESPMFLTLRRRSDNRDLEHIAWDSIQDIARGRVRKKGLSGLLASGGLGNDFYVGALVRYSDDEYERELNVLFDTGGENSAEKLVRLLWDKRDTYISMSSRRGDIRR
jgi:hypothetical protein